MRATPPQRVFMQQRHPHGCGTPARREQRTGSSQSPLQTLTRVLMPTRRDGLVQAACVESAWATRRR